MNYKVIFLISLIILIFGISMVFADDTVTFTVGCKHIEGASGYADPLFILSETCDGNGINSILADYLVYPSDYYKIKVKDTVTLKLPSNSLGYCEVVKINNNNKDDSDWW